MSGMGRDETVKDLELQLNLFDPDMRRQALESLADMAARGNVSVEEKKPYVNLHSHTSFSFNAYGYSPSRFAWEACKAGLEVAGIVDFDCLDGVEEFLEAGTQLNLKTIAGFETRVFIPEYSDKVINSPGEPGVYYLVGTGFTEPPAPDTSPGRTLADMANRARERNIAMMEKINDHLGEVTIDYEEDVIPLTPSGNATERHMLQAYEDKARETFDDPDELAAFWADKLGVEEDEVRGLLDDIPSLKGLIRKKLMKRGGVGYAKPDAGTFPDIDEVVKMTLDCGALPSGCWLDGTSEGEADPMRHFKFLKDKGIPTLTIIPDRNWDIDDPEQKQLKLDNLEAAVKAGQELEMPILVGTEMNKHGQKFVDEFNTPELSPYRDIFLDGAHVAWGHTLLKMTAGMGYTGEWADEQFGSDTAARNEFFRKLGEGEYPEFHVFQELSELDEEADAEQIMQIAKG